MKFPKRILALCLLECTTTSAGFSEWGSEKVNLNQTSLLDIDLKVDQQIALSEIHLLFIHISKGFKCCHERCCQ